MSALVINEKSQITLRRDVLEHLGLRPGGKIVANKLPNGRIELKAAEQTGMITDVFGLLKRRGRRSLSTGQIGKLAARGWAGKR